VGLPPRRETADAFARAAAGNDPTLASWAAVGAVRLGDVPARARVEAVVTPTPDNSPATAALRVRAALALAGIGDAAGVPVLGDALDHCDDVLLCRLIILSLGKLHDARAVPALLKHLPEVQNRREMVDALGDIADSRAREPLLERLRGDEYVPVRVQSAVALEKLGDPSVIGALEHVARHDTEPTVVAAANEAARALSLRAAPRP
jgi:HEAT repeat protein